MSSIIKSYFPPIIYNYLKKWRKKSLIWEGDYESWEDAMKDSVGYDELSILEKSGRSVQEVIDGKALFERDSVAFYKEEVNHAILAHLLLIAKENLNKLSVCDFGGALGSTYLQHRKYLEGLDLSWSVIEQKHYIDYALKNIKIDQLHFYYDIASFAAAEKIQVLLLSSVLSYLPDPFAYLDELLALNFEYVIIDKTPIHPGNKSRLTVQHVPPSIYKASYPCWFISEELLKEKMINYDLIDEFEVPMDCNLALAHKGFAFRRK
jgi:putative methyltransferase (TIGR04325 family)